MAEVALEPQAGVPDQGSDRVAGRSPWSLAWRRLRRNRLAPGALRLFAVILASYLPAGGRAPVLLTAPNGLSVGPLQVEDSRLWLPTLIIGFIYVPYVYRPVRGSVLSVAEKEFVEAAVAQGASNRRLIFSEILPNVITVVIVLLPLMIATTIITEAALSFLGIGVQPPGASWGTIIADGQNL